MNEKVYILIAGVNGAGKSTFYHSSHTIGNFFDFCDAEVFQNLNRINADEILREFGDWRNSDDAMKAGRIAIKKIRDYFKEGLSFCQETTLCGKSILKNIETAKNLGYKIGIIFVGVDSVELAQKRVQERVKHGGHGISAEDIERRYYESFKNLNMILKKCDGVLFYDNTSHFRSVAVYDGRNIQLTNSFFQLPKWFEKHIEVSVVNQSKSIHSKSIINNKNNPDNR